ncbi:MAG TPA: hypothetical protein VFU13_16685 [Steroidobacteraceae bacterium]|nr:hypothetical protein [Steroidobacteraceae bacterium]
MKKVTLVAGGIAVVAVFAGVLYFARDPAPQTLAAGQPSQSRAPEGDGAAATASASGSGPLQRPVVSDPRLAALMVSPDNAMIEFVAGSNGKVIKEIDNDPASPGYRKPLREYTYAGDRVVILAAYQYLGDQVRIRRIMVTYKPDGSVDQYRESTSQVEGPAPGRP